MKLMGVAAAAVGLVFLSGTALAESSVGLNIYGVDTDDARNTDDGIGFRFNYGWGESDHLRWELQLGLAVLETGTGAGTDFYQTQLGLDASWRFFKPTQWQPYLLLGVGAVYDDVTPDTADDTNPYINAGLGLLTAPVNRNNMRLRFDARYVNSDFANGVDDIQYSLGVEIPLWQERVVERIVEKVVYQDVPVIAPAPVDSDRDGVVDANDQCPSTLAGSRVDASGCAIKSQVIVLTGIQFASSSANLLPNSFAHLDGVARAMHAQRDMRVEIAGHTDASGGAAMNKVLSERRAHTVRNYLLGQGVPSSRLVAHGYGESNPITSNETAEGRAQNRRVEFRILGK